MRKTGTTTPKKRGRPKKTSDIHVDNISYKAPGNGLPKWIKDVAEERGYGDAVEPVTLFVTDDDINNAFDCAAHGDGAHCVMAQAGQRLGAKAVYFYRTTAWIDFGIGPIVRYMTSRTIYNNVIVPFDKGKREDVIGGLYHLTPPGDSKSLRRRREYQRTTRTLDKNPYRKVVAHTDRVVMASHV